MSSISYMEIKKAESVLAFVILFSSYRSRLICNWLFLIDTLSILKEILKRMGLQPRTQMLMTPSMMDVRFIQTD